jgi:DNA replication protein DnaC
MCECDIAREEEAKAQKEQDDFEERMRSIRLALHTMRDDVRWRFEMDTDPGNPIAKTCRKYVDEWDKIRAENIGIIFYGTKGSGKTFYASCIYNALKDRHVTVGFSSAPNLMNIMGQWDKTEIFDAIKRAQMLVIDDIGAERDNSYSAELMYSIIDARYKTGKPTIVTTNLDIDDMKTEQDMWRSRIYDRILEMCPIPLKMQGDSRRLTIADERKRIAKELLDWTKKGAAK